MSVKGIVWGGVSMTVGLALFSSRYTIMYEALVSGCLPWRAYLVWEDKTPPKRYDIIYFRAKNMKPVIGEGQPIGKMAAGLPGDRVQIRNGILSINGVVLGDTLYGAKRMDKPAGFWDADYVIPEGKVFAYGTEENSWDSRYWGLYNIADVTGRVAVLY